MPKKSEQRVARGPEIQSTDDSRGRADRLFRAATECIRQRERYARLVESGAHDTEQEAALRVACLCDRVLHDAVKLYEQAAATSQETRHDDWWHKANSLWHASREYERRHADCDKRSQKLGSHSADKLGELAMQYDLEASALLALRLAVANYRSACPDAELSERPQTFVA
jgi:hypothetical protein